MQFPANQTEKTNNHVPLMENTPDDVNSANTSESEQITQVQRDSVITRQDLPDQRLRYGFTLVILSAFLFVTAIYYGIINP